LPRKRGTLLPRVSPAAKIVGRVGGGGICVPKRSPPRADVLLFSISPKRGSGTMADDKEDPVQQAADEELPSAKLAEDPTERVAAELTRIRFEMTAIRQILQGRRSTEGPF